MQDKYKEATNQDLKSKQTDWKRESEEEGVEEATGKGLEEFLILFCLEIFPLFLSALPQGGPSCRTVP